MLILLHSSQTVSFASFVTPSQTQVISASSVASNNFIPYKISSVSSISAIGKKIGGMFLDSAPAPATALSASYYSAASFKHGKLTSIITATNIVSSAFSGMRSSSQPAFEIAAAPARIFITRSMAPSSFFLSSSKPGLFVGSSENKSGLKSIVDTSLFDSIFVIGNEATSIGLTTTNWDKIMETAFVDYLGAGTSPILGPTMSNWGVIT